MKAFILPHYNLQFADVTMVKFKDTDKQRAVYRIDYKNESYCLKKVYYDESNLLYVYSAMEWLYRNDLNVPKLLSTNTNHRYISYMNMLFILTPWV
ncbi:MAG: CotS family spore coat protein, partial [Clostridium sp.]